MHYKKSIGIIQTCQPKRASNQIYSNSPQETPNSQKPPVEKEKGKRSKQKEHSTKEMAKWNQAREMKKGREKK